MPPRRPPSRAHILALRDALAGGLIEREMAARLALLAALCGEHLVLFGPPGVAKSLLARRLRRCFRDARYFERLLTRFSVPEELFGPFSIKGLENDRYERQIEGYLPTAHIAFLDETFKANSAILNALLTLSNEREFDNGTARVQCPLISIIGASNELPDPEGNLGALYDRFLFRLHVDAVTDDRFGDLLDMENEEMAELDPQLLLGEEDLVALRAAAKRVRLSAGVRDLLTRLRAHLRNEQIPVSDRRWRKVVKALKVAALCDERDVVSVWDAWLLQHMLWEKPEQRAIIETWYGQVVGTTGAGDPAQLVAEIVACEQKLQRWQAAGSPPPMPQAPPPVGQRYRAPAGAKDAFLTPITDPTCGGRGYSREELGKLQVQTGGGWFLFRDTGTFASYLADPANLLSATPRPTTPRANTPAGVPNVRAQVADLRVRTDAFLDQLQAHRDSLLVDLASHPFLDTSIVAGTLDQLDQRQAAIAPLQARLRALDDGLARLP